ncbi:MAG: hypothetical protein KA368_10400 [Acidobacteria bacterium]|nr:hypothetical protein [Acidobacteriota bacterium]
MPTTLRPPEPVTEQIAELSITGNLLCLIFRERNESFRQLARELRFRWNQTEFRRERKITAQTGSVDDRLIEAAYKLLTAGFIVSVPEGTDADLITAGDYVDEHTRWVMSRTSGKYAGWFAIQWAYGEELYFKAKALPGARYSKPCVVAPPEYFEEVADFAGLYDFRFSDGAEKLMTEAREKRLQMVRVELKPRVVAAPVVVAAEVVGGIADEFRDTHED